MPKLRPTLDASAADASSGTYGVTIPIVLIAGV
jgi:hypothetical protein